MSFQHICVATRFFESDPARAAVRLKQLDKFVANMLALGVGAIGIAVNIDADCSNAIRHIRSLGRETVKAFPVTPWGRFMPSLQALLQVASTAGFQKLLCISVEADIDASALAALDAEVNSSSLVAGLRMPGHVFQLGEHACDGLHAPWNTVALWRVKDGLDRIGFASTGEALSDPGGNSAGVEEVGIIAIYQRLYDDCGATVIDIGEVTWNTELSSKPASFDQKLHTKASRAALQLESAHLLPGRVQHRNATVSAPLP